jgi:hypothetical protein
LTTLQAVALQFERIGLALESWQGLRIGMHDEEGNSAARIDAGISPTCKAGGTPSAYAPLLLRAKRKRLWSLGNG